MIELIPEWIRYVIVFVLGAAAASFFSEAGKGAWLALHRRISPGPTPEAPMSVREVFDYLRDGFAEAIDNLEDDVVAAMMPLGAYNEAYRRFDDAVVSGQLVVRGFNGEVFERIPVDHWQIVKADYLDLIKPEGTPGRTQAREPGYNPKPYGRLIVDRSAVVKLWTKGEATITALIEILADHE